MKKRIFTMGLIAVLIVSLTSGFAFAAPNENSKKIPGQDKNINSEQIVNDLTTLDKETMTQEIEDTFSGFSLQDSTLIPLGAVLLERIGEYSEDELIALISDRENDLNFRVTILQLYGCPLFEQRTAEGNLKLRGLLLDEKTEDLLKENLIVQLDYSDADGLKMLDAIANGANDALAFQAIKKLNEVDPKAASKISDNILNTYKGQSPAKVNAALKVKSEEYRKTRIQKSFTPEKLQKKQEFVDICKDIIAANPQDDYMADCAVFALSDMTDSDAITAIVQNDKVDDSLKVFSISQNVGTLLDMSTSEDLEVIDTISDAMDINPLVELNQPLSQAKGKIESKMNNGKNGLSKDEKNALKDAKDQEKTLKKLEKSLEKIAKKGNNANQVWKNFYNEVN